MAKKLTYALTTGDGTLDANVLHDAIYADATYVTWKGTWDATEGVWNDSLLHVEFDATNIYLTVPDATDEAALLIDVDAQRV